MEEAQVRSSSEQEMLSTSDVDGELRPGLEQVRTAKSPDDEGAAWPHALVTDCTLKAVAKKAVFCAAILVVWMALAIPTVMFYLPQVRGSFD